MGQTSEGLQPASPFPGKVKANGRMVTVLSPQFFHTVLHCSTQFTSLGCLHFFPVNKLSHSFLSDEHGESKRRFVAVNSQRNTTDHGWKMAPYSALGRLGPLSVFFADHLGRIPALVSGDKPRNFPEFSLVNL